MTLPMKPFVLAFLTALLPLAAVADTAPDNTAPDDTAIVAGDEIPAADTGEEAAAEPPETEPEGLRILDAAGLDPDDFLWEWRILAVMADTPNDPAFISQMREINDRPDALFERDIVVIIDSDRNSGSLLRQRLRPRGFMLAIIDKDGEVKQRRPAPRDVRELSAVIDRFPLRRQEMLDRMPSGR